MSGLPTLQVLLDDGSGSFPFDITSKCLLGPGLKFTRGREDWQGGVTAGSLSLTLNNSDGRFSPGSTILASPSPIKVDQRIRVRETINGVTLTRFTGYVKSWPVAWPAVVSTFSTVTVTATDAQARAERQTLRSVIEEEVFEDSPSFFYTMGESSTATSAGDTSGNQSPALTPAGTGTAVVFGTATGPTTDGLTAATFAAGQYLKATPTVTAATIGCYFATSTTPAVSTGATIMSAGQVPIYVGSDGKVHTSTGVDLSSTVVTDGLIHCLIWEAGHVFLDGVDIGSPTASPAAGDITVGGGGTFTAGMPSGVGFTGSIAHLTGFTGLLSAARALVYSQAGLTGMVGESGTARLTRTAGYANVPVGTLDTSLTNMAFVDITGKSAWEAIQQVVDAEGGVAFFDGSGNLTFHNRNRVPAKTSPDLTLAAASVTPDVQPVTDDQQIVNYLETTSDTTSVTQVVQNTTSITSHGKYPSSVSYLVQTDAEALDRGNWLVTNFAEPTTRYGTLTINLYGMTAANAAAALAAVEINTWLRVTGAPSQTPGSTTVDVVVEGYTEDIDPDTWTLTLNVVSQSLFKAWVLDDTTLSVLDTTTRLYV